ncbi:HigA family addiction module antitoxin [Paraburkholderia sp. EG304]|uniref:HigA family addiction module antitoxin n=1 Tax=Paraburkholderia sp. EG304 TaxID=3237015 RepID=UPI00397AFD33
MATTKTTTAKTAATKAPATKQAAKQPAAKRAVTKQPAKQVETKQVEATQAATQPEAKQVATKAPAAKPATKQPARKPAQEKAQAERDPLTSIYPKPGAALAEKIASAGLEPNKFARTIGVAPRRINEIIEGKRRLTADTALRLARYFGEEAMYWMGLQAAFEIEQNYGEMAEALAKIAPLTVKGSATDAEAA